MDCGKESYSIAQFHLAGCIFVQLATHFEHTLCLRRCGCAGTLLGSPILLSSQATSSLALTTSQKTESATYATCVLLWFVLFCCVHSRLYYSVAGYLFGTFQEKTNGF